MIADQNFYDICFRVFFLQLRPTAHGQSVSAPNICLRSNTVVVVCTLSKFELALKELDLQANSCNLSYYIKKKIGGGVGQEKKDVIK